MNDPLVSVVVITYNSGEYILAGLESVKAQTYKNIELIISDDCSTDNTREICLKWLEKNAGVFKRTQLIEANKNTGVAGNLNRGINAARGEWIKTLSGDDKFFPYTISKFISYAIEHPYADIIFGKMFLYNSNNKNIDETISYYSFLFAEIKNQNKQYRRYLKYHYVPGPGLFYSKKIWHELCGYDERYPFCEEYPFTLKLLKKGYIIYYIDEELYQYEVRDGSLSNSIIPNYRNLKDQRRFFNECKFFEMLKHGLVLRAYDQYVDYLYKDCLYSGESAKMKIYIVSLLNKLSPVKIYVTVKNIIKRIFAKAN